MLLGLNILSKLSDDVILMLDIFLVCYLGYFTAVLFNPEDISLLEVGINRFILDYFLLLSNVLSSVII